MDESRLISPLSSPGKLVSSHLLNPMSTQVQSNINIVVAEQGQLLNGIVSVLNHNTHQTSDNSNLIRMQIDATEKLNENLGRIAGSLSVSIGSLSASIASSLDSTTSSIASLAESLKSSDASTADQLVKINSSLSCEINNINTEVVQLIDLTKTSTATTSKLEEEVYRLRAEVAEKDASHKRQMLRAEEAFDDLKAQNEITNQRFDQIQNILTDNKPLQHELIVVKLSSPDCMPGELRQKHVKLVNDIELMKNIVDNGGIIRVNLTSLEAHFATSGRDFHDPIQEKIKTVKEFARTTYGEDCSIDQYNAKDPTALQIMHRYRGQTGFRVVPSGYLGLLTLSRCIQKHYILCRPQNVSVIDVEIHTSL